MADNTTPNEKPIEPTLPLDTKNIKPTVPIVSEEDEQLTEKEIHAHDHGKTNLEQNHLAEQQLKNQQSAQNDRELFPKGLAQEHGKGRG